MSEIRFSVVLPAYNVENLIGQSLDCLLEQTCRSFEVIVAVDCATDATGAVADAYRERFLWQNISYRVIYREKNGGVGAARNSGMSAAVGEYILFLDPDDVYERNLLEVLDTFLSQQSDAPADMVLFGFTEDYYNRDAKLLWREERSRPYGLWKNPLAKESGGSRKAAAETYSNRARAYGAELMELEQATMLGYAWNKAYRLSFLQREGLSFSAVPHIEDILFNLSAAEKAGCFAVLPQMLYHYRNQGQARLTDKYLPDYFSLQKRRVLGLLKLQLKLEGKEAAGTGESLDDRMAENMEGLDDRMLEVMAASYFRSFQSMMSREISHGASRAHVLTMAGAEAKEPLYRLLKHHLPGKSRVSGFLYEPLARGEWKRAYGRARLILLVQKRLPGLYARLKQHR